MKVIIKVLLFTSWIIPSLALGNSPSPYRIDVGANDDELATLENLANEVCPETLELPEEANCHGGMVLSPAPFKDSNEEHIEGILSLYPADYYKNQARWLGVVISIYCEHDQKMCELITNNIAYQFSVENERPEASCNVVLGSKISRVKFHMMFSSENRQSFIMLHSSLCLATLYANELYQKYPSTECGRIKLIIDKKLSLMGKFITSSLEKLTKAEDKSNLVNLYNPIRLGNQFMGADLLEAKGCKI